MMSALVLCACANRQSNENEQNSRAKGAISGAVAGGVIGFSMLGGGSGRILGGIVMGGAGAYIGTTLADNLNQWDRVTMREATYKSLASANTGEPTYWESDYSSNRGQIVPTRTYLDGTGRLWRDYRADMTIDGTSRSGVETACLTSSGSWIIYPS